ncbi:MAG: DNA (cytosine-5-)-methyltransferase [Candidatus Brocadiales bacterium]|nr:DNA (cytosine-5-)-methyltransferase [Candidatus Brocadiales bacterium]
MRQESNFLFLLERSGLSRKEFAEKCGRSTRTVARWETGEVQPEKLAIEKLESIIADKYPDKDSSAEFSFIDLFAGIGGFRKGFESIGGQCVFTSEWDKYSRQTYIANFGSDHPIVGDIENPENLAQIPKHDVLLAGFPCQPFSIAGVSKKQSLGRPHGFKDPTQGTLFFSIKRIIEKHQPAAFLLENVKNLKSHDKGRTFKVIAKTLDDLGYHWEERILDAKALVPQHRERIFIAGFRNNVGFSFKDLEYPDALLGPKLSSILHPQDGSEIAEEPFTHGKKGRVGEKYTLTPNLWKYLKNYADVQKAKGNGFGFGLVEAGETARTLSARYYKDGSEILITQKGKRPRRLTPRECARLMGYDKLGDKPMIIPVSDTQAYKQFGNGVVVPVVETVAKFMKPYILESMKS